MNIINKKKHVTYAISCLLLILGLYLIISFCLDLYNNHKIVQLISNVFHRESREYFSFSNSKFHIQKDDKNVQYDIDVNIANTKAKNTNFNYINGDYSFSTIFGNVKQFKKDDIGNISNHYNLNCKFQSDNLLIHVGMNIFEFYDNVHLTLFSPTNQKINGANAVMNTGIYNTLTNTVSGKNIFIVYRDGTIKSDTFIAHLNNDIVDFDGNFITDTVKYKIFAQHAVLKLNDGEITDIVATNNVRFIKKNDNSVILGQKFNINQVTQRVYGSGSIEMISEKGRAMGDEFIYDGKTGVGILSSKAQSHGRIKLKNFSQ